MSEVVCFPCVLTVLACLVVGWWLLTDDNEPE